MLRPRHFILLSLVIEELGDLLGHGGHDGGIEESVETGKEQCADNNGDKDLDTGVNVAFGLLGSDSGLHADCGIGNGVLNLSKHG